MDCTTIESRKALNMLKTARGQIEAVIGMVEDGRYCVDVSRQIMAVQGLLKKANLVVLHQHLQTCVREAILNDDADTKLEEIMMILETYAGCATS